MAAQGSYGITITAVDHASKQIAAINKNLQAMRAPVDKLNREFKKFSDLSGLTALARGFRNIEQTALSTISSVAKLVPVIGGLTAGGLLTGILRLTDAWASQNNQLRIMSSILGVSARDLAAWGGAGRLAGVGAQAMTASIGGLGRVMQDAVMGKNADALRLFQVLGINIRNSANQAKSGGDVFVETVEKINAAKVNQQTKEQAMQTLGLDPALLSLSRGELEQYRKEMEKLRPHLAEDDELSKRWAHSQTALTLAMEGFGDSVARHLEPVLQPIMDQMTDWVLKNREWIATKITEYVERFAGWVKEAWPEVKKMADHIQEVVDKWGGWKTVLETLFELMAARFVISMITPFVTLTARILTATAALKELGLATSLLTAPAWLLALLSVTLKGDTDPNSTPDGFMSPETRKKLGLSPTPETSPIPPLSQRTMGEFAERGIDPMMSPSFWMGGGQMLYNQPYARPVAPGSRGYDDFMSSKRTNQSYTSSADFKPEERGMLDLIASGESPGYSGSGTVNPTSGAFGRYQFLESTWKEVAGKLGFDPKDRSPANQDRAARFYAQQRYSQVFPGRDLFADYAAGGHERDIATGLNKAWTSLPGGSESHQDLPHFTMKGQQFLREERAKGKPVNLRTNKPPEQKSVLRVDINHNRPPDGTSLSVRSFGDIFDGPPRVGRALPSFALPG